ncbi:hypothetical protein GFY24_12290 [Nocardia sp. SYP-A9097]|uniref:hypothetical protein n=1 Tax=Nocardia sp. SYP-A9097 TaxID=2663237 RepID=UPI00129B56B8|nr:hypothetical protein [Nocardia sp. SYP-A9097]MRH88212.1 hypothetical protein [Nocardia sp. SYP-A9097]
MTETGVLIRRLGDGLRGITPAGAATVLDAAPRLDVMVLEVAGGHLTWNVLAGPSIPAAVVDDVELAQEWVWAIYGERIALALGEGPSGTSATLPGSARQAADVDGEWHGAAPALPALASSAWRLAYAHWASRWWPSSTLDGIAALDQQLLNRDIAVLTEQCEALLDGADAIGPPVGAILESRPRASDYALAAGDEAVGGLILGRGVVGWDWRRCPPGLVDASEKAVSWQVVRDGGVSTIAVAAVAAPGLPARLPAHLRPWARIATGGAVRETELRSADGAWVGETSFTTTGSTARVDIYVPDFGITSTGDEAESRRLIREFALSRLRRAVSPLGDEGADSPLLAEIASATDDSDF